jgi:hypothetical protein
MISFEKMDVICHRTSNGLYMTELIFVQHASAEVINTASSFLPMFETREKIMFFFTSTNDKVFGENVRMSHDGELQALLYSGKNEKNSQLTNIFKKS